MQFILTAYDGEGKAFDEMLKDEPYLTNGVWKKVVTHPFRLAKIH